MAHSITTNISEGIEFSKGQRNYIIYLYSSLSAEEYCSELCWSGIGESKRFSRKQVEQAFGRLHQIHMEADLTSYEDKFTNLPEDTKEKRVSHPFPGATMIENPPDGRHESFHIISEWYKSLLNIDFEYVVIDFS